MDESTTRRKKIDLALYSVDWEQVPDSQILNEQRAYVIVPGRVEKLKARHPKKVDYILEYKGMKLAVVEAKSDETDVSVGVPQAKQYAEMLQIRYAYSTNGDSIYFIDMGVRDAKNAVARGQKHILLTMATGTGKTYTAFQICWKLFQTKWNLHGADQRPRILFIADRNILANQAVNDFEQFPEDAMVRITPDELHKNHDKVPTARHLYFTIFQTFMCADESGEPYYKQYPADFFDFIIIDECHRGGANDESQWRELMDYFSYAYQLGMTATPRRTDNANTYRYFGDPVYSYSLKQGIADGYLTPFRVRISESNIDEYVYDSDDEVEGEIDTEKTYTESDFYNGKIEIRQRDEHRVKELLSQINPDEKTIVFCATQLHAHIIRDMINQYKKSPASNYCERVTADDGSEGEETLKLFQDNERKLPTILTTSQKLSTGVDARNVRNIVLMRPVNNMVEFKQIIGRGTRLFDDKYYFTIYDFVGANRNFQDAEWDGDPYCPVCGNYPCTCNKQTKSESHPESVGSAGGGMSEPCPVCGHLPCTCEGGGRQRDKVKVKLSSQRTLELKTTWTEKFQYGDELISIEEFIQKLFGRLPMFFNGPEDLRKQWEHPDTRRALLNQLEQEGFHEDKLQAMQRVMGREDCDLLDVLEYLAYETTPMERKKRVELVREDYYKRQNAAQKEFIDFLIDQYLRNGYQEFTPEENLSKLLRMKYVTVADAKRNLNMGIDQIRKQYVEFQRELYKMA